MTQQQREDLAIELNLRHGIKYDFVLNWIIDNIEDYAAGLALIGLSSSQFADKLYGNIIII